MAEFFSNLTTFTGIAIAAITGISTLAIILALVMLLGRRRFGFNKKGAIILTAVVASFALLVWQPWELIRKYNQDEVLAIAKGDLIEFGKINPNVSVNGGCSYLGNGKWWGTSQGFYSNHSVIVCWYFHEKSQTTEVVSSNTYSTRALSLPFPPPPVERTLLDKIFSH